MKIRALTPEDMPYLDALHEKSFSKQFDKTDFLTGFLGAFVITDDDGKIVMGGGVRPIAETVIVTDVEANPHLLGDALLEALKYSKFAAMYNKIELLHAFVKDPNYARHLVKHGFLPRQSTAYFLDVTNG